MAKKTVYNPVSPQVSFPKQENSILEVWDKEKTFEKSLEKTKNGPFFSFYDGPPFATGTPHYGHILAGILKDIVPRYWTMRGYHVPRYFGWDCHGVPVEFEVNKEFDLHGSAAVIDFGIDKYNETCRSKVQKYVGEWRKTVRRMGRWVDMDNDYKTMDLSFMQSVWWVFKEMWEKGLIYEGYKVVPYSIGISTPLSNFEASQNYRMVQDPAITARFKLDGSDNEYFLAWTTTPWTLPSNLGLAVGKEIDYVKVRDPKTEDVYIMAQALLPSFKKELSKDDSKKGNFEILETIKGSDLLGLTYEPLFDFFKEKKSEGAFQVIDSDHVTTESGTGIVHMAPAFGEEDFYACQKAKMPIVNPVDDDGLFTSEVPNWQGVMVKDADKDIIKTLKDLNKLFKQDTLEHSYPHCDRTDTPLIYRAVSSWFVNVEEIKDRIVANNQKTQWVPESLRDGRFGNWLSGARDWAISRNRYWGTPLPIWRNEDGEIMCIGSAQELSDLTGEKVEDLHIHFVDQLEIPSPTGKSPLKRIRGVLDCWFESGSMPYAQWGYPYNEAQKGNVEKGFPADFIAEGLDQTRGWFYTLMVISSALFDKPAFKNVVVNGMILAEDGKKMSKRLKNYPDPMEVLDRHGADALRLFLINSPVVRAQEVKFSEDGVKEIVRKILLRWWNAYSFFVNYANTDDFKPKGDFKNSPNILDQWILSRLNSLILNTNQEMEGYRLYNVVPALVQFIEELTNTYIRFNRRHFWQNGMPEDKRLAYETLYEVLSQLSVLMAPFTPFLSEATFENLSAVNSDTESSVHLAPYPKGDASLTSTDLERSVFLMDQLCLMGRNIREKIKIKAKIPLKSLRIIHREQAVLERLKELEDYFTEELNVRKVIYDVNEDDSVQISAKANFKKLGQRLGPKMKAVAGSIAKLDVDQIIQLEKGEMLSAGDEEITLEDVEIRRAPKVQSDSFQTSQFLSLELDPSLEEDQIQEGMAREVIRRIQMARKNADFNLDDRIRLEVLADGDLKNVIGKFSELILEETLSLEFDQNTSPQGEHIEDFDIDGQKLTIGCQRIKK